MLIMQLFKFRTFAAYPTFMQQTIKGFVAQHLGVFSPSDLVGLLFALFLCASMNFILTILYRKWNNGISGNVPNLVVYGAGAVLLVAVVQHSLPLALAAIALLLVIRVRDLDRIELLYLFLALIIGVVCGSGAGLVACMCFPALVLFLYLTRGASKGA